MDKLKYTKLVIDRFEEMITKEIEKVVYGNGNICPTALYDRLTECINAREELGYEPVLGNVEKLLDLYNYDEKFIKDFIHRAMDHSPNECPEL